MPLSRGITRGPSVVAATTVAGLLATCVLAVTADVPDSVKRASLVWNDAAWSGELGSMPLGNGDVSSNVWVEENTGDLLFYVGKSDAFDANAQPVKVGRVRISMNPPLWSPSSTPAPSDPSQYLKVDDTIGNQNSQIVDPSTGNQEWPASSHAACPGEAAKACSLTSGCVCFSCYTQQRNMGTSMFQLHRIDDPVSNKGDWTYYHLPKPPPSTSWSQTLDLETGSIRIEAGETGYSLQVLVDANAPVLRVLASRSGGAFDMRVALEVYRNSTTKTNLGRGFCSPRFQTADTVLQDPRLPGVVWAHENVYVNASSSVFGDTIAQQGIPTSVKPDPFKGLIFGGVIQDASETKVLKSVNQTVLTGSGISTPVTLEVTLHTEQPRDIQQWTGALAALVKAQAAISPATKEERHNSWWAQFWSRSHISITPHANSTRLRAAEDALNMESHYVWQRFLDACDGRGSSAIKFNGQAFTVDVGKGPDYRDWGACYWFQNTRQPYYNCLAAGDLDIFRPMVAFYANAIPWITARVRSQFNISGGVWPETMHQFGTYNQGDWGCSTPPTGATGHGDSTNTYIRFHTTGSLELALFVLDDYKYTGDVGALQQHGIPICRTLMEYYRNRYPNKDVNGKTDMWPAQALETYQCPDPTSRSKCGTNPSTDISGLQAVLTRLVALPTSLSFVTPADRAAWQQQLDNLPPLPVSNGLIQPLAPGYTNGRRNSENTQLYPVHPFRLYGTGKDDLALAQATYAKRPSPCNDGWCQDVIDAAMLNLTTDAIEQVIGRANAGPAGGWRFPGFAAHYQDFEPSVDHYSFMRTAMQYMLLSPLDDDASRGLLLPTWPTDQFDVDFKLHFHLNTTVEAACTGGKLTKLVVTPASRTADFQIINCPKP